MPLRKIAFSLLLALLAAAATAGAFHHKQNQKAGEAAWLRRENSQLRYQAYLNHRQHLSSPEQPSPAITGNTLATPPAPSPAAPEATGSYRDAGHSTPAAALQTLAWACDRSDSQAVLKMLYFDPAAREKAQSFFYNLPAAERERWNSPENMTATLLTLLVMARPFPSADVLDVATFENLAEDRVVFRGARNDRTQFQKTGDTWKIAITEEVFDQLQRCGKEIKTATDATQ